ncbi:MULTISPECIES: hypothetical protein [unclassified Fibrobacter]|jgi:hypothetical protein|uniref:hypothetical protein n=1 Tax=unclassified Fibrobacter TaxID=2634177 RepID=UPI00091D4A19|nr:MULTISPECIES: hypothetical protein [unclassified Fibrobacter]MBR6832656.1 hypothetical protein [Fibrobacter sp.]MDD5943866.1 hypothetical protein [Fibrobacter sp.]SHL76330.1 hypothetical protein SAMN05720762_11319 [Fibrobacter sp. UWH4]
MKVVFWKKEYVAPKMTILDMRGEMSLLAGSGPFDDGSDADEYDDEFGFNLNKGTDRHA